LASSSLSEGALLGNVTRLGLNSQNAGALDPELSTLYAKGIGGGEIEVVEESALIADVGPEGTEADLVERKRNPDEISIYIVKEGDTLGEISELFNVSVNTIVWANDIKGKNVSPGDELVILPITGVRHTVLKGETLESIAKKYKSDLLEVAQFNGKDVDDTLALGEIVIVPDGTVDAPKATAKSRSSSSVSTPSGGGGYLARPVNGGRRTQGIHGYNGIDIAAPTGTPVYAAASGKVIISKSGGWFGGYGNNIVIKHGNGTQTLYAHLSRNDVWSGAWVEQGQQIGAIGNTGRSTGPHLHFEVRGGKNPF
jgi:LysM repeat protein